MVDQRSAALVVRVWLEDADGFRARLLDVHDCTGGGPETHTTVAVVSSPGDVLDAVRDWLEHVVRPSAGPVDGDR